jgi:hypothetical protein
MITNRKNYIEQSLAAEADYAEKLQRLTDYAKAHGVKVSPLISHDMLDVEIPPGADAEKILHDIEAIFLGAVPE